MICTRCGRGEPEVGFYRETNRKYKRTCKRCCIEVVKARAERLGLNRRRNNPFAALELAMGQPRP